MNKGVGENHKTCPQCKVEFSCYTEGCWCNDLPQIMPFSSNEDCLCPNCLKVAIDKRIKEHSAEV